MWLQGGEVFVQNGTHKHSVSDPLLSRPLVLLLLLLMLRPPLLLMLLLPAAATATIAAAGALQVHDQQQLPGRVPGGRHPHWQCPAAGGGAGQ